MKNFDLRCLNDYIEPQMSLAERNFYCSPFVVKRKQKRLMCDIAELSYNASMVKIDIEPTIPMDMDKFRKEFESIIYDFPQAYSEIRGNRVSFVIPKDAMHRHTLGLKKLLDSEAYEEFIGEFPDSLPIVLGETVENEVVIKDLKSLIHLIVAGSAGSGKTVQLHNIINSLMYHVDPTILQFVLMDMKGTEFVFYEDSPYLLSPVCDSVPQCVDALKSLNEEMSKRFQLLKQEKVFKIEKYNSIHKGNPMPYIVVVIDEFADLILQGKGTECQDLIIRLAQKSRACGIHLILATQNPKYEVCTTLIKANIPNRIALTTSSHVESNVILDTSGAENLTQKGDMLFKYNNQITRLQGAYISEEEIAGIQEQIRNVYGEKVFDIPKVENTEESTYIPMPFKRAKEGDVIDGKVVLSDDLYLIALTAIDNDGISRNKVLKLLHCGADTAREHLEKLREYQIINEYNENKKKHLVNITEEMFLEHFIKLSDA